MSPIKTTNASIERLTSENRPERKTTANIIKTSIEKKIAKRFKLKGLQTSNKTEKPFVASKTVATVESSSNSNEKIDVKTCKAKIINILHIPPGKAFLKTFEINRPLTMAVVGCNVSKNPGRPMVSELMRVH